MIRNPPPLPRASRLMVFGSYAPALVRGAGVFVQRAVTECGATDIVVGINRVQGREWKLLHDPLALQAFCEACRAWGVRPILGYWDKPHDDARMWSDLIDLAALCKPYAIQADIEGDVLNDKTVDHAARVAAWKARGYIEALGGVPWALTVIHFHQRLAAPYIALAQDHVLVQVLSHRNPAKPGTMRDSFLPGFLTRDACHAWRSYQGLAELVWLCAGYRQTYQDTTPAEAVDIQLRAPFGYGHDAVGVFSWPWIDGDTRSERAIRATIAQAAPVRPDDAPSPVFDNPTPNPNKPMLFEDMGRLLMDASGARTSYAQARGLPAQAIVRELRGVIEARGWAFFDRGALNLNIVGVRDPSRQSGVFDDLICVAYRDAPQDGREGDDEGLEWVVDLYAASTDPGPRFLAGPINPNGCAILKEGQYRGAYRIGWHGPQKIRALVQAGGPVTVYRDDDRDDVLDIDPGTGPDGDDPKTQRGRFGINFHPAGLRIESIVDGRFKGSSAGCQVFASRRDHDGRWMPLLRRAAKAFSNSFTYTLLLAEWLSEE